MVGSRSRLQTVVFGLFRISKENDKNEKLKFGKCQRLQSAVENVSRPWISRKSHLDLFFVCLRRGGQKTAYRGFPENRIWTCFLYVWGVLRVAKINLLSSVFAPRRKRYYMQPRCDFLQNNISGRLKMTFAQMARNVIISTPNAISRKSGFAVRKSWKCQKIIGLAGEF